MSSHLKHYLVAWFIIVVLLMIPMATAQAFAQDSPLFEEFSSVQANTNLFAAITPIHETELQSLSQQTSLLGIVEIRTSGSSGANGYRQKNDFTTITAIVEPDDNGITDNQLWLCTVAKFSSCNGTASSQYECTTKVPNTGTDVKESKSYS